MKSIYYYELVVSYVKGKKKLTEYTVQDYAVTSATNLDDIVKAHTLSRMAWKYYGPKYNGEVRIEVKEVISRKKVGTQIRSKE